ncbi:hypothetical protein [Trinickia fusca]|uniref:hypothetical protein n=1 Tax=Trinickia fusca TaxID=2419777 RepID=UPI0011C4A511|nr:hypothetical protein [Trinickia fusca]
MIDTAREIERRLSALDGLALSGVHHAAGTLTLQFGPLRSIVSRNDTEKKVGTWALHVQCPWTIGRDGQTIAQQSDLCTSDAAAKDAIKRMREAAGGAHPVSVIACYASSQNPGGASIVFSGGLMLKMSPTGEEGEDWRLFSPGSDAPHFVIDGGTVDPDPI